MGYEIRYPKPPEDNKPKRKTVNTAKSLLEKEEEMSGTKPAKKVKIDEDESATYSGMAKATSKVTTGIVAKDPDPIKNKTLHKSGQ